ncbi:MAG: ATP-dependent protease [Candidatus Abyssobacteria bacterium SURF_5]|uniref:endopeptidase La n=1 Tax=Abyssobacteria bacterium (strain SURF_5) TaxID=2093360 RepID=A0A3A4NN90_ABYX5|nr:MAG: ATP-dependent protease [Candidatus Abyssubacteria bacterium SURF_5]
MEKEGIYRTMPIKNLELKPEQLRWKCDPALFKFKTTADIKEKMEIIGQGKALKAMETGLAIGSPGFNVYVAGLSGTGKMTTVKFILEKLKVKNGVPNDKCFVHNFKMPDMPRIIELRAGFGKRFRKDMEDLIDSLTSNIPKVFESENYQESREEIVSRLRASEEDIFQPFQEKLNQENLALIQMKVGTLTKSGIAPLVEGKPIPVEEYVALVNAGKITGVDLEEFKKKYIEYDKQLQEILKAAAAIEREVKEKLEKLDRDFALFVVDGFIESLKVKYGENEEILDFLEQVKDNVLLDIDRFKRGPVEYAPAPGLPTIRIEDSFLEYQVNVIVDNSETKRVPIVIENSPTFHNLFGTVETSFSRSGEPETNHMRIKAGSILRADGGYLVFNAMDALTEPYVWKTLKRALINKVVEIPTTGMFPFFSVSGMKPEPININLKVVMVGDYYLYRMLHGYDEDFRKVFKVKSDFVPDMENSQKHIRDYLNFMNSLCNREGLLHLDPTGAAAVIEFGVEEAGRQKKITTRFSEVADVIREASYLGQKEKVACISSKHVQQAIKDRIERVSQLELIIKEYVDDGRIRIDTAGSKIGQINGLAVYHTGDHVFGKPVRITAETSMGRAGIVNIERESKLSGSTHDKGMLIMSGYLRGKYAQDKPLTLSASICFEQSYAEVDGDSASTAELYVLISSVAQVPIRQNLAVTGSIDQKGNVQPIGGVNEKIEGFFKICKTRGLKGNEGVLIPRMNVDDLMLNEEIVEAVRKGKFHIFSVNTVDEGLELLTGMKCGTRTKTGKYPKGTLNRLVVDRLEILSRGLKEYYGDGETKVANNKN